MPTKTASELSSMKGRFEYIEAKIRRDAEGMTFGGDFEWLCKWFLENAPRYRGQFDKVWLWKDWPDRWGTDAGIDLVARTRAGELWAIQAKADHPDRAISKREIDSFLSESNRSQFAYRLLMATTDDIGATARRTLHGQEKPVGLILRGHFLTEEVQWPVQIGGTAARLPRWTARPHQATAIEAVVNGYREHDRGRLIMACGTGKTLTALWIAERLQSSLTLVLVPSLSLVQQNLAEWGRHSIQDFDTLVVCSDESVSQKSLDAAVQSAADLGVKVTTTPAEIRQFLVQSRKRPAVVFATYQSSDRIAAAQAGTTNKFDLAICDEAHRLAGHAEGLFATVLDGKKIKASKRLFMTATPRYFKEHVKRRAAELEFELVSMDDAHVFGPEFHVLTFHEAISAKPEPLLTDYQVVVIGVTDREAKAWAERATLVRTAEGLSTDARTLAAQIGLAKAMQKYDLRKLITFHSSVAKAARFVDATRRDSLPGVIPHLTRSARPSGKLWTKHISGHTPAGLRKTWLDDLGDLPEDTRGILSNCACLGEGVDVPVLDGVAFIDPKRSMVDIIQAVGRVIRKAEGKQIGTIVIPVFIDETEDADHVLSQSAFEPVWQVLKALRAHDRRLADELDQLRLSLGSRSKSRGIKLPKNIHLDVPQLLLHDFEQAFYVRTVEATTSNEWDVRFSELEKFKEDFGHCNVPVNWAENPQLASWVTVQRSTKRQNRLSESRIARLDLLGFEWTPFDSAWDEMFSQLKAYLAAHPGNFPTTWDDDPELGKWVIKQRGKRRNGALAVDRISRLDAVGFMWEPHDNRWEEKFAELVAYKVGQGNCNVPAEWRENLKLSRWVTKQRANMKSGELPDSRITRLNEIGFVWNPDDAFWEEMFAALAAYKVTFGNCNVPQRFDENLQLSRWVNTQRTYRKRGKLSDDRIRRLDELGFIWQVRKSRTQEIPSGERA